MRIFPYITVGKILNELRSEGIPLGRVTFYRLEKKHAFPVSNTGGAWRVYTPKEAEQIKLIIKKIYKLETPTTTAIHELDFFTRLHDLRNKGIVTDEEFETIKRKKLSQLALI